MINFEPIKEEGDLTYYSKYMDEEGYSLLINEVDTYTKLIKNGIIEITTTVKHGDDISGISTFYKYKDKKIVLYINRLTLGVTECMGVKYSILNTLNAYGYAIYSLVQFQNRHPDIIINLSDTIYEIGEDDEIFTHNDEMDKFIIKSDDINTSLKKWFMDTLNNLIEVKKLPDILITNDDGELILNTKFSKIVFETLTLRDDDIFKIHGMYEIHRYHDDDNLFLNEDMLNKELLSQCRFAIEDDKPLTNKILQEVLTAIQNNLDVNFDNIDIPDNDRNGAIYRIDQLLGILNQ